MPIFFILSLILVFSSCKPTSESSSDSSTLKSFRGTPTNTAPKTATSMSLVTPSSSPGNISNPTISLNGVQAGDNIKIYSDSSCATLLGSVTSTGTSTSITLSSQLSYGIYNFYTKSFRNTLSSNCSASLLTYHYKELSYSVSVSWEANREKNVNRFLGGYTVFYSTTPGFNILTASSKDVPNIVSGLTPTTTTLTNLSAGTYYVKIQAYYLEYKSAPSPEVSIAVP